MDRQKRISGYVACAKAWHREMFVFRRAGDDETAKACKYNRDYYLRCARTWK